MNKSKKTTTSIIIPTYNGSSRISNLLNSLINQKTYPDELIIVIDGSQDNTEEIVKNIKIPFPTIIVTQENKGRAGAKNAGAKAANYDYLMFLDDDMTVPNHWLTSYIQHHSLIPDSIVTGELKSPSASIVNAKEINKFKEWLNQKWNKSIFDNGENSKRILHPYLCAGNFSISKKTFDELGGFDSSLKDLEDKMLAIKALSRNIALYSDRRPFAYHHDPNAISFQQYLSRLMEYKSQQIMINDEQFAEQKRLNKIKIHKKFIFYFFSYSFLVKLIDIGVFSFLPMKVRFKLYDIILTANLEYK